MSTLLIVLLCWCGLAVAMWVGALMVDDAPDGSREAPLIVLLVFLLLPTWGPLVLLWQLLAWCFRHPHGYWGQEGNWRRGKTFRFWGLAWKRSAFGLLREAKVEVRIETEETEGS